MKKIIILNLLVAMATWAGKAQIVCHVEGELLTDKYGDDIVICEDRTDLRLHDNPSLHVKSVDGKFSKTIECDHIKKYTVFLYDQYRSGSWRVGYFFTENGTVHVKLYADRDHVVESDGEQGRLKEQLDNLVKEKFGEMDDLFNLLHDKQRQAEVYTAEFISSKEKLNNKLSDAYKNGVPERAVLDSINREIHQLYDDPARFTPMGLQVYNKKEKLRKEKTDFVYQYYAEHPMLESLYRTLDALDELNSNRISTEGIIIGYDPEPLERLIALYHDKLINYYPEHPVHQQIATAEAAFALQPGKPYIDYNVRNTDGQLVPISSLIKGKVALIDLWASWCGPCRHHSMAMIPIYEKYKDQGFTVIAIAREDSRRKMERAMRQDGYPWPSLLELNDENQVWLKNGAGNGGGAMILVDRDGTILSNETDAEKLEPIIRKALKID